MNENSEQNKKDKKIEINRDTLKRIIIVLAGLAAIILIFGAGVFVGEMKARFSYRWAENYQRNFAGPRNGFLSGFPMPAGGDFIESHGVFGQIIKINPSTDTGQVSDLVIKGQNNMERIVMITSSTAIQKGRQTIKKDDLKVGDNVTVIGSPNDQGQIEAKLIRVF